MIVNKKKCSLLYRKNDYNNLMKKKIIRKTVPVAIGSAVCGVDINIATVRACACRSRRHHSLEYLRLYYNID